MNKLKQKFLVNKTRKGNTDAFGEIYDEYIKKIYSFIFFRVPSQETAQDLSHEVFISLLNYLKEHRAKEITSLQALLYKISRNLIANYYASRQAIEDQSLELIENIEPKIDSSLKKEISLDTKVDQKITVELIMKHVRKIKNEDYQEIIILRFIEDMDFKSISEILNKKPGTLRTMLQRALQELKKIIEQQNE